MRYNIIDIRTRTGDIQLSKENNDLNMQEVFLGSIYELTTSMP
jgi:hypothetical protein